MAKANSTSFKKGQSGNSAGRPKGTVSEYRKKFMEIAKLGADDAQEIYKELRERMKKGEPWAYQLYVKDIIPKKSFEPTTLIKMEEGGNRLEALMVGLCNFVELTHGETLEEIKVLQNADLPTQLNRGNPLVNILSPERVKIINEWVKEAIEVKKNDNDNSNEHC